MEENTPIQIHEIDNKGENHNYDGAPPKVRLPHTLPPIQVKQQIDISDNKNNEDEDPVREKIDLQPDNVVQGNQKTQNQIQPTEYFRSELQSMTESRMDISFHLRVIYSLSKKRFIQLGLYILSDFANSLCIYTFQTIGSQVSKIYNIDPFLVSLNLSIYSLMYPFISFLGNYLIDQKGAAFSVRIGLVLTITGFLLRLLISDSWNYVLLSCVFCGAGGPLIFNAKCSFQANWFKANDLPQITTISTIVTSCNAIIGVLLPGFYFASYDYENDTSENYAYGKDLLYNLIIIECILVGVAAGLALIFLKEKPALPPSFVSTLKRENYKEAIRGMLKNKSYIKLNIANMLLIGNTSAMAALFSFAIEPFGFSSSDTTYCAAGMVVAGIIGSIINAPILKKHKKFKKTIIILSFIMLINVIIIGAILNIGNSIILIVFASLFGSGYQPLLSTIYEFSCEVVFPIGEGSAQGFIMGTSSIFGFICITTFGAIVRGETAMQSYTLLIYQSVCTVIGIILIYTSTFSLNRFNAEQNNAELENQQQVCMTNNEDNKKEGLIVNLSLAQACNQNQNQNNNPEVENQNEDQQIQYENQVQNNDQSDNNNDQARKKSMNISQVNEEPIAKKLPDFLTNRSSHQSKLTEFNNSSALKLRVDSNEEIQVDQTSQLFKDQQNIKSEIQLGDLQ